MSGDEDMLRVKEKKRGKCSGSESGEEEGRLEVSGEEKEKIWR